MSTFIQVLLIVACVLTAAVALAVVLVYASVFVSDTATPAPYRAPMPPGDGDWGEPLPPEGEPS